MHIVQFITELASSFLSLSLPLDYKLPVIELWLILASIHISLHEAPSLYPVNSSSRADIHLFSVFTARLNVRYTQASLPTPQLALNLSAVHLAAASLSALIFIRDVSRLTRPRTSFALHFKKLGSTAFAAEMRSSAVLYTSTS